MKAIAVLDIDLGKDLCSVGGLDEAGNVLLRRRMRRDSTLKLAAKMPACVMAMEACCGAHHLGRQLRDQGDDVRLMSAEYVRPYVKAQKNDDRDAEEIAEAATCPTIRFVELKTDDQLDMQSLHRARDRLVGERTTLINQLRAVLIERGIVIAKGRSRLERQLDELLKGEVAISGRIRSLNEDMREEWRALDKRIEDFDAEFEELARTDASMSHSLGLIDLFVRSLVADTGRANPLCPLWALSRLQRGQHTTAGPCDFLFAWRPTAGQPSATREVGSMQLSLLHSETIEPRADVYIALSPWFGSNR